MAGSSAIQEKLKAGIEAARRGEREAAARLLRQVVDAEPNNEVAWMWLASMLDNLTERRAALEQALRINPGNSRARDALKQLESVLPPSSARRTAAAPRRAQPAAGGGINPLLLVLGILAALIILVSVIFGAVSGLQPVPPNAATQSALRASLLNSATPPPTVDPASYTATPFYGIIVTPANLPLLPPTFTPTFTPSPVPTEVPSATPYPLTVFRLVYAALEDNQPDSSLFGMSGDGTSDQPIGAAEGFNDVAVSPDGRLLAFVRTVTYNKDGREVTAPELFIAPADNPATARRITEMGSTRLSSPSWAADSIRLAFSSNFDGDDDLWTITEDGNNLLKLTENDFADRDPAWSPDGGVILYASEQANRPGSGLTEIFSITEDGATIRQLTDSEGSSYQPSWSPDGTRVVFASDRGGDGDIYLMDPNGQRRVLLTLDGRGAEDRQPAFTPTGQNVIFLSNRDSTLFRFHVVDLQGNQVSRLADPGRDIQSFSFRPLFLR